MENETNELQKGLMEALTDQSIQKDSKEVYRNEKLDNIIDQIHDYYKKARGNEVPSNRMTLQEIVENVHGRTIEETAMLQLKALYRSLFGKEKASEAERNVIDKLTQEAIEAKKEGRPIPQADSPERKEKEYSLFAGELYDALAGPIEKTPQGKEKRALEREFFKKDLQSISKEAHEVYSPKEFEGFNGVRLVNYLSENPNALSDAFDQILAAQKKMASLLEAGKEITPEKQNEQSDMDNLKKLSYDEYLLLSIAHGESGSMAFDGMNFTEKEKAYLINHFTQTEQEYLSEFSDEDDKWDKEYSKYSTSYFIDDDHELKFKVFNLKCFDSFKAGIRLEEKFISNPQEAKMDIEETELVEDETISKAKEKSPAYQKAVNCSRVQKDLIKGLKEKGYMDFGFTKNLYNLATGKEYEGFSRAVLNQYVRATHSFDGRFITEKQISEFKGSYALKEGARPINLTFIEKIDKTTGKPFDGQILNKMSSTEMKEYIAKNVESKEVMFQVYNGRDIYGLEKFKGYDKRTSTEISEKNKLIKYIENQGYPLKELKDSSIPKLVSYAIEASKIDKMPEMQKKICSEMLLQKVKSRTPLTQDKNFRFIGQNDVAKLESYFKNNRYAIANAYDSVVKLDYQIQKSFQMDKDKSRSVADQFCEEKGFVKADPSKPTLAKMAYQQAMQEYKKADRGIGD